MRGDEVPSSRRRSRDPPSYGRVSSWQSLPSSTRPCSQVGMRTRLIAISSGLGDVFMGAPFERDGGKDNGGVERMRYANGMNLDQLVMARP